MANSKIFVRRLPLQGPDRNGRRVLWPEKDPEYMHQAMNRRRDRSGAGLYQAGRADAKKIMKEI